MNKTIAIFATVISLTSPLLSPTASKAENGQIAAGVVGGLIGGALLGGALASRPPPPVVYYQPEPVYVVEPVCRFVGERYWDGYGWQIRRVRICN